METCKIVNLYNLNETIASALFDGAEYPWELLPKIGAFILELGKTLPEEEYDKRGENIW
ncbi:MAG: UDP-N-acetylglucosamine pyrophosphorylase, partial [Lachnospiraceae bacterium]|nr:UDP-N-acetylglucosamine pyrophosphorylase [Lachnospiraceae bacterium]